VRKKNLYLILIVFGLLAVWQFWPEKQVEVSLGIIETQLLSDLSLSEPCRHAIFIQEWKFSYPESIEAGGTALITLAQTGKAIEIPEGEEIDVCPIVLEARLDISPGVLLPGKSISEKLIIRVPNTFSWQFQPASKESIFGTMWLSMYEISDESDREFPIFTLPFVIKQTSIFRLQPAILRLILFSLCAGTLIISPLFFTKKSQ